jgi:hypothetical protein
MDAGGDDPIRIAPTPVDRKASPRIVGGVGIAVVIGAIAVATLAILGSNGSRSMSSPAPSFAAIGGSSSPAAPTIASTAAISPSARPLQPGNPPGSSGGPVADLANQALPGAPELVLFGRVGDDVTLYGWRPGDPDLAPRQTISGAARDLSDPRSLQADLSPDGRFLLIHFPPATPEASDTFRVYRLEGTGGREIWQSTTLGSSLAAGFLPTGQLVVTQPGLLRRDRGWTVIELADDGAVVHDIPLPPFPAREPAASIDLRTLILNYTPAGASADGRWIYAMSVRGTEPVYRPAYRISIGTGNAERIDAFPTTGPARIVSTAIDARTGRLLLAGPHATSDEGLVQAWRPGAAKPDFQMQLGVVFFAAWTDDGGVVAGEYDVVPGPFRFRVLALSADGEIGATLLEARGTNAALVGVSGGFAEAYVAGPREGRRTLVVIRLADGARSGLEVADPDGVLFAVDVRP